MLSYYLEDQKAFNIGFLFCFLKGTQDLRVKTQGATTSKQQNRGHILQLIILRKQNTTTKGQTSFCIVYLTKVDV